MFSSEAEKRTNFLHVRNHVLNSTSLNRCLLELTARKLRCFLKSEIVWFQIKIFYYTIYFKEISTLKIMSTVRKTNRKTYKFLAFIKPV